jgi:hypothetical protein
MLPQESLDADGQKLAGLPNQYKRISLSHCSFAPFNYDEGATLILFEILRFLVVTLWNITFVTLSQRGHFINLDIKHRYIAAVTIFCAVLNERSMHMVIRLRETSIHSKPRSIFRAGNK